MSSGRSHAGSTPGPWLSPVDSGVAGCAPFSTHRVEVDIAPLMLDVLMREDDGDLDQRSTYTVPPRDAPSPTPIGCTAPKRSLSASDSECPSTKRPCAARQQSGRNGRRRVKRNKVNEDIGFAKDLDDRVRSGTTFVSRSLCTADLPVDSSGFCGLNEKAGARRQAPLTHQLPQTLDEFIGAGFTVVKAKNAAGATCITDSGDRVIAVREEFDIKDWPDVSHRAHDAIRAEDVLLNGGKDWDAHRGVKSSNQGLFCAKGMQYMSFMQGEHPETMSRLRKHPDVARFCILASAGLRKWQRRIHGRAQGRKRLIQEKRYKLPFSKSVFTSIAVNFGPRVSTIKHRDWTDKAGEMCAVQAFGRFDHTKGGHLVLWDLKLLLEFPAGSLILFPSAVLSHSNVPVAETEERTSIVQYTPGGVARYVENGFRTETRLEKEDTKFHETMMEAKRTRWARGLADLSTIGDLVDREDDLTEYEYDSADEAEV